MTAAGPQLEGRTALVTGGGTGLGAAIARVLAAHGAHVLLAYRSSADAAAAVAEDCRAAGGTASTHRCDVASDADCRALAAAISDAGRPGGRLDVLVNNAGTTKAVDLADLDGLTGADFHRLYDVNVVGAFRMVRACRGALEASHAASGLAASVLNVSSIAGVTGRGSSVAYAASKAALNGMTLSLARALSPAIRVNAVCPGFIDSDWWSEGGHGAPGQRDAIREGVEANAPLRAASTPEDIADAAAAFCLPGFRHVTGETLLVDAGLHMTMGT